VPGPLCTLIGRDRCGDAVALRPGGARFPVKQWGDGRRGGPESMRYKPVDDVPQNTGLTDLRRDGHDLGAEGVKPSAYAAYRQQEPLGRLLDGGSA